MAHQETKEEKEEVTKATYRMPKSLHKELQIYGVEHDMTDQEVAITALRDFLKEQRKLKREAKNLG